MAHMYTKYSVSLLIREIQSKTMMRYVCTPIRMPKTRKNGDHQLLARMLSDRDCPSLSEGTQNQLGGFLHFSCDPATPFPGTHPREMRIYVHPKPARRCLVAALSIMALTGGRPDVLQGYSLAVGHPDSGTLPTMKEKLPTHARSQRHYAERKKSTSKGYVLDDSIYMTF